MGLSATNENFPLVSIAPLCLRMPMFIKNRKEICVVWMF